MLKLQMEGGLKNHGLYVVVTTVTFLMVEQYNYTNGGGVGGFEGSGGLKPSQERVTSGRSRVQKRRRVVGVFVLMK